MPIRSKTTLRTAWKESPAVIRALGEGKQFLLFARVADEKHDHEARLVLDHLDFFLLPKRNEDPRDRIRAEFRRFLDGPGDHDGSKVTVRYRALVTEAVMVLEGAQVAGLSPFHIWTDEFVRQQIHFDPLDPVFALTCKVQRLDPAISLEWRREYDGAGNWTRILEEELPPLAFEPVIEHNDFLKQALDIKKAFAEVHKNPLAPEPGAEPDPKPDAAPVAASS